MLHDALLPAFTEQKKTCVEVLVKEKKKATVRGERGALCGGEWKKRERG